MTEKTHLLRKLKLLPAFGLLLFPTLIPTNMHADSTMLSQKWAGFGVSDDYWAHTGAWLGPIHVKHAPWNFSSSFNSWLFLQEDRVDDDGGWLFLPRPDYIDESLPSWDFAVENTVTHTFQEGYNWNSCTLGRPQWWWPENETFGGRIYSDDDWARYFDLWKWSGSENAGPIRLGFNLFYWEADKGNPTPESPEMLKLYLFLDHMKERNMQVYIANWDFSGLDWLETEHDLPATTEGRQAFAESIAGLCYHLRVTRGYTNVVGVSLANEPDGIYGTWEHNHYASYLWPIYGMLDSELRDLGIRDEIRIYGPDTTWHGHDWLVRNVVANVNNYGTYIDVFSDHLYRMDLPERTGLWRIDSFGELHEALSDIYGYEFPVIIAEFGPSGPSGQGSLTEEQELVVYRHMVKQASQIVIYGLNRGLSGFQRWQFAYDGYLKFAGITADDPHYWFKPYGPVYYPHAVLARYVEAGWKVYRSNGDSGLDQFVNAAVLRCPDGIELSVLLANEGGERTVVNIDLSELSGVPDSLNRVFVSDKWSGLRDGGKVDFSDGTGRLVLQPESITTLTTLPLGNLSAPMEYALQRIRPRTTDSPAK